MTSALNLAAPSDSDLRLLGDIGGTNARFALQAGAGAPLQAIRTLACTDHATLEDAMRAYLAGTTADGHGWPSACAFGIANPVVGDEIRMTNHHWSFSIRALQANLGFQRLVVVNDFTALALAVPGLPREHLRAVGGGHAIAGAAMGLIGPGTGLGVSGLVPMGSSGVYLPLAGEGGHVTLAAESAEEFAVLQQVRARYGHASAERVLSGAGLVDLYRALRAVRDGTGAAAATGASASVDLTPAGISQAGLDSTDPLARDTLSLFCALLGGVAGNLALTLGARGGIYIGGGIVPRLGGFFDQSPFRTRFEAKGRFQAYLAAVPTWVIDAPTSPALDGAAKAFELPA